MIIIGAGIAGLFLALELSEHCSVLVLDKQDRPALKYWLSGGPLDFHHEFLSSCVDVEYDSMAFTAYDGTTYKGIGKSILWDSEKLIEGLQTRAMQNGAIFKFNNNFYSYSINKESISIYHENTCSQGRLLIDCMGSNSTIIGSKGCFTPYGQYRLHGGEIELKKAIEPTALHNVSLGKHALMLEVFPTSKKNSSYPAHCSCWGTIHESGYGKGIP